MDWFIICPIRGVVDSIPDDDQGYVKTIQRVRELADDIKPEGYKLKDIKIIRGEMKELLPPGDWQLIDKRW